MISAGTAAQRVANDALAVLHPEEWERYYLAALEAQGVAGKLCGCGRPMVRSSPTSRWPVRCADCKEAVA